MAKPLLMKKLFLVVAALFFLAETHASHIAGGELQYTWLRDSTYHVIAKFYRDCGGNTAPQSLALCYKSDCDQIPYKVTMRPLSRLPNGVANGTSVTTGCAGYPNNCQQPGSTLAGYAEWWFEADVTLPHQCEKWVFSISIADRNASTNLTGGTNNPFYVEAVLNSVLAPGNSSPVFTVKPVPFVCINNPYTFNNGASDYNGDSLVYSILQPRKGDCDGTQIIAFSNAVYNTTNNPISTANTFSLNGQTGQFTFTPTLLGASTLTLQVSEYRNGLLIGSTMRDIQVRTLNCNAIQPVIRIDPLSFTGGQVVNGRIQECAGTPINFCFTVKAPSASTVLVASDNHGAVTPGAAMSYYGQGSDSIRGCFSWIPTAADSGLKIFTVTVKDSTCLPPGIAISQSYVLPIYVYPVTAILNDTAICLGGSASLKAIGGNVFTWSVLSGGSPLSSLSCTGCSNPVATPATTTSYVVVSNLSSPCTRNRDTVTVTVINPPAPPVPSAPTPVCRGNSIHLSSNASAASYSWSGPAGFASTLRNPVIANAQLPNGGTYTVIAMNGACASQPGVVNVSVITTPQAPRVIVDSPACEGRDVTLRVAGVQTGLSYFWTAPGGGRHSGSVLQIPRTSAADAGVYQVYASAPGNTCVSPVASFSLALAPGVAADFELSKNSVCQHDTLSVEYTGGNASADSMEWVGGERLGLSGAFPGMVQLRPGYDGEQTLMLIAKNGRCRDTVTRRLTVYPAPPAGIRGPDEACIDQEILVRALEGMSLPLRYDWDFSDAAVLSGEERGVYRLRFGSPGLKTVTLRTDDGRCSATGTIGIDVHEAPAADILSANRTTGICTSDTVSFAATYIPDHKYRWLPERYFSETGHEVQGRIGATGFVVLELSDPLGCKGYDSIAIRTEPCCDISLPNAFTPNGDGRNDVFKIITVGHHALISFNVLNRWGQTVFAAANGQQGWDGTSGGKTAEIGSYYYLVRYRCSDGNIYEKKGDLVLIR